MWGRVQVDLDPPQWWGESVRPRSPCGGRLRCQAHISTMLSIHNRRHAAQESLPLMVGHLYKLNPGETSLEWGDLDQRINPSSGGLIRREKTYYDKTNKKQYVHAQMHPVIDPTEVDRPFLVREGKMNHRATCSL